MPVTKNDEPPLKVRSSVYYTSASDILPPAYDRLSEIGKGFIALGLLAPVFIIIGQSFRWFYKGVWPTEYVSLIWNELGISHPPTQWFITKFVFDALLALPIWFGVMCFLVMFGYTLKAVAHMLRLYVPRQ